MKSWQRALLLPWANKVNYTQIVQQTAPTNLIAYWPMAEASGTVAVDASGNGRDGTYTAVTLGAVGIGDGRTAASLDGTNSWINVFGASFQSAFSGAQGTVSVWWKVSGSGVWTDAAFRNLFRFRVDASNHVQIFKSNVDNRIDFNYLAGGTSKTVSVTGLSTTAWQMAAITWKDASAGDQVIAYLNGVQTGATQTGNGTWAGSLSSTNTTVGASSISSSRWSGTLAHAAVWTTPLSAAQIATLAVVP